MHTAKQLCGAGCLNVLTGPWYWQAALVVADNLPLMPFRLWLWVYDHLEESVWRPGHIEEDEHQCQGNE